MATDTPDWTGSQHVSQPEPASSNLTVAPAASTGTVTLTPPADATGFQMLCTSNGNTSPTYTVTGGLTSAQYLSATFPVNVGGRLRDTVSGDTEALTFEVSGFQNSSSLDATAAYISWLFGAMIDTPVADASQPLPVTLQGAAGLETAPARAGGFPQLVVAQMPPQYVTFMGQGVDSAGTFTLIAGVAGKSIRLRDLELFFIGNSVLTAGAGYLQDASGNRIWQYNYVNSGLSHHLHPDGFPLTAGDALELVVVATSSSGFGLNGAIFYDQY